MVTFVVIFNQQQQQQKKSFIRMEKVVPHQITQNWIVSFNGTKWTIVWLRTDSPNKAICITTYTVTL